MSRKRYGVPLLVLMLCPQLVGASVVETVWEQDTGQPVSVEVIDGLAVREDVIIGTLDSVRQYGVTRSGVLPREGGGRSRRAAHYPHLSTWPEGRVPYRFDASYTEAGRKVFESAADHLYQQTGICFTPYRSGESFVQVARSADRCHANGGMMPDGNHQFIKMTPACMVSMRHTLHEMGHTLGLGHEHQRVDRDRFISGVTAKGKAYDKDGRLQALTGYDRESVMQYLAESLGGAVSLDPTQPLPGPDQLSRLSAGDIRGLAKRYPGVASHRQPCPKAELVLVADASGVLVPKALPVTESVRQRRAVPAGQCLTLQGNTPVLAACSGGEAMRWVADRSGRVQNSGKPGFCLTAPPVDSSRVQLSRCSGGTWQKWRVGNDALRSETAPALTMERDQGGSIRLGTKEAPWPVTSLLEEYHRQKLRRSARAKP